VDISHHSLSRQPYQPAPVPGCELDEALQEIRARLGCAPQRLYATNGRPIRFGRGKSAWAFVHYVNGTWVVSFGDWRTQAQSRWTSHSRHELTDIERRRLDEDIRRLLEQERLKQEGQRAAAARSVQAQWEALPPAPADHPYLVRKGVQPHGIRARAGSLVVPLRDIAGQLWSWQTIDPEGRKRFCKDGRTSGLFFTFGEPGNADAILVCEGWATGATLYEALARPVVAAMNCGNLLPVAQALQKKYPQCRLVICADDDWKTPGNPGVAEAEKAARFVGAAVAIPVWTGARGEKDTDFNDLALAEGREAVQRIVEAALAAPEASAQGEAESLPETPESKADNAPAPDETAGNVPGVPSPGMPNSPGAPDEEKGKAPGKAKGKAKPKAPAKAKDKAPAKAGPGPEKAEGKAPVKAKGKAPAKAEDKAPDKAQVKAPVKAKAKAKDKAPGKAEDKAEVKAPVKAKAKTPGKAKDKAVPGPGKAPDKAGPGPEKREWTFQDSVRFNLEGLFGVKLEGPLPYEQPIRFRTSGLGETGWCILYRLPSGVEAARYGDHLTGVYHQQFSKDHISQQEKQRLEEELRQAEQERQQRKEEEYRQAAEKAQAEWESLLPAYPGHPCLQSAGVQPHDARVTRKGALCVPLRDTDWQLWNLWFFQDGETWKVSGGRTRGLFAPFGERASFEAAEAILVCQDWLTGALLYEATGRPVATSDRLEATVQALREWLPEVKLAICVDNDPATLEEVEVATRKIGAIIVTPPSEGEPVTFLDLANAKGREALRQLVDNALRQNPRPGKNERPCFWLLEEPMENRDEEGSRQYKPGVYYCGTKPQKVFGQEVRVPIEAWLCSPIRRLARTTEWPNGVQGVRLAVQDGSGWRDVVLPRETLASRRHREILLAYGASLEAQSTDAKAWLVEYLQQPLSRREYTTERTGWHKQQYVFPDVTIGKGTTILFTGARATDKPLTSGELADWQKSVAALAAGNPLLAFSISLAFAGPLLELTGHNAVLVQLVGRSTTGKTTCLLAANSVVGPPELTTTWRATPNGLEQQALAHCDGFWGLDEIGQVDAKTLDNAVYTLANGTAKQRAKVYDHGVGAAPTQRWRVAALSTGEKTLETLLAMDKRNVNAGQAVRFIEIPAEERYGAFTELHGYESGAALADALRKAVRQYYGTPIRAFVEQLSGENRDTLNRRLDGCKKYLLDAVKNSGTAPGAQASRILASMALVALAGEQATAYGITGWSEGEALKAALHCYRLWARRRAAGADFETTSVIRLVYDFITRHGNSRFSPIVRTRHDAPERLGGCE
jgi:putative DNA primase/helicase